MKDHLAERLESKRIIVVCGPGGVGKTTIAAALGMGVAARCAAKVLVVTVDPARRLIDALSIAERGNEIVSVPGELFAPGNEPKGELHVAMVDAKASWDALVRKHAHSTPEANEILDNPLYRAFSGRFALSQEYVAMERVFELYESGEFDLIIIDTPPSRDALDFLDAPGRMVEFFSSRLLWWLTVPARSRVASTAARPFLFLAGRVIGRSFLRDVARFFFLLQAMYDGFVVRSRAIGEILGSTATTFVVTTTLEHLAIAEATRLAGEIGSRALELGPMVVNRVLPKGFADEDTARLAGKFARRGEPHSRDELESVLQVIGDNFLHLYGRARYELELLSEVRRLSHGHTTASLRPEDVGGIKGLVELCEELFANFEQ